MSAHLRKGKTKSTLLSAIDSALLAVEVFNKPRTAFRIQAYISLMVVAWTRLFHAYFHHTIGDKYYYKKKGSNRYETVDGERKAWELRTCIQKYGALTAAQKANLELFIKLRNKIEHRHIDKRELDLLVFGECQALLYNFETLVVSLFGDEYSMNENLAYSLQFSTLRSSEQEQSSKRALAKDFADLRKFIATYRSALPQETFDSQEYSIKLIQVPKISNTNRNDAAIEFVKWSELNEQDRKAYRELDVLVKDRIVKQPIANLGGMKPGKVLEAIQSKCGVKLSHHDHKCLYVIFRVRPDSPSYRDPFETDTRYCYYDEVHGDYIYTDKWVEKLVEVLEAGIMKKYIWTQAYKAGREYDIQEYC